MKKYYKYNIVLLLSSFLTVAFFFQGYIHVILDGIDKYVFTQTDFGQYLTDIRDYNSYKNIQEVLSFWRDPGLFLVTASIQKIWWLGDKIVLIYTTGLIFFLSLLQIGLIIRKLLNTRNIYLVILTCNFLFFQSHAFVFHNSRQMIAQFVLFGLLYMNTFYIKKVFIPSVFLAGCFLLHRMATIFSLVSIFILLASQSWKDKKIYLGGIWSIILGGIWSAPFLLVGIRDWLNTLVWFAKEQADTIGIGGAEKSENLWFLWIRTADNKRNALLNYFLTFPWIIIFITSHFKLIIRKKILHISYMCLFLCTYVLLSITFSNRVLITLEWILIIIFIYGIGAASEQKNLKILLISCMAIFNFTTIFQNGSALTRKVMYTFPSDESLSIMRELNKEPAFFFSDGSGADLLAQLNYTSMTNYRALLNKEKIYSGIWIYSMFELSNLSVLNYETIPYVHEIFKWYNLYIVTYGYSGNSARQKLLKKVDNDSKNNLEILFIGQWKNYFNTIIKVNNASFFDSKNYFDLNIKNKINY